jgi:hypothetical protein
MYYQKYYKKPKKGFLNLLAWQDSFRTFDWIEAVGDLDNTNKEVAHLLLLV